MNTITCNITNFSLSHEVNYDFTLVFRGDFKFEYAMEGYHWLFVVYLGERAGIKGHRGCCSAEAMRFNFSRRYSMWNDVVASHTTSFYLHWTTHSTHFFFFSFSTLRRRFLLRWTASSAHRFSVLGSTTSFFILHWITDFSHFWFLQQRTMTKTLQRRTFEGFWTL